MRCAAWWPAAPAAEDPRRRLPAGARGRVIIPGIVSVKTPASAAATVDRSARVLTGFRPTGPLHLGHWAGNVENLLRLQDERDTFVFIADWHMLTTHYDRTDELPGFTRDIALDLLAAGLDPGKVTL